MQTMTAAFVLLMLMFVAPGAAASPTHQRTYSYYGFDYGQTDGNYCSCKIGPCPPYGFLIGQKTYACDGRVYSWGITQGTCFTLIEEETEECPSSAVASGTDLATPPSDPPAAAAAPAAMQPFP